MAQLASAAQCSTTSTQKASAARSNLSANSSTKTLAFANNAMKDTDSTTALASSLLPDNRPTPAVSLGTATTTAWLAPPDTSMFKASALPSLTSAGPGTQPVLASPATQDTSFLKPSAFKIPTLPFPPLTHFAKPLRILSASPVLTEPSSMLTECVPPSATTATPGMPLPDPV